VEARRVGQELGAEYLIEGSLRKAADRIRVTAQLIEATKGSHLWAERYEMDSKDIFAIQDQVTRTVASTLVGQIERSRIDTGRRKPTGSWAAYDCVLQALYLIIRYDIDQAEPLLMRAIDIDPGYSRAYGLLSMLHVYRAFWDWQKTTVQKALTWAQKGVSVDDTEPYCLLMVGVSLTYLGRFEESEPYYDRAIALNPNYATAIMGRANLLGRTGRTREALEALDTGAVLDPFPPPWYWDCRAIALFVDKQYEEVIKCINHKDPKQYFDHARLAAAYAHLGRDQEARTEAVEVLRKRPNFSILAFKAAPMATFKDPEHLRRLLEGFRKAGLPK
jgi:tetratricopeptide (TPR) repeat protein